MEAFVEAPSEAKVYKCTKRQLWEVAEHYGLEGLRKDLGKEELQELIRPPFGGAHFASTSSSRGARPRRICGVVSG